jgi:hypothetical protein
MWFSNFTEVYFYAHGAMGVLHLLIEAYKNGTPDLSD